jgi:hypothetical protein
VSAAAETPRLVGGGRSRPGSLVAPVVRHTLVAAGAGVATFLASAQLPAEPASMASWLAMLGILGAVAAVVSMGWLGLPFLLVGSVAGILLEHHLRLGPTPEAAHTLVDNLAVYGAGLVAATVGYLAIAAALIMFRRRR